MELPINKNFYTSFFIFTVAGVLFLITVLCAYFYLPVFVGSRLAFKLTDYTGIQSLKIPIRKIGFSGSDAGPVVIGQADNPVLIIQSIQIDYSLKRLLSRHIDDFRLCGLTVNCKYKDGHLSFPGFDFKNFLAHHGKENETAKTSGMEIPSFDRIQFQNCIFIIEASGMIVRIPFDIQMNGNSANKNVIKTTLNIYHNNQKIPFAIKIDLNSNNMDLAIETDYLTLGEFADITSLIQGLDVSGKLKVNAKAGFTLSPFRLDSSKTVLYLNKSSITYNNVLVKTVTPFSPDNSSSRINIWSDNEKSWHINADSIELVHPVPANIFDVQFHIAIEGDKTLTNGKATVCPGNLPETYDFPVSFQKPFIIPVTMSAAFNTDGNWDARFSGSFPGNSSGKTKTINIKYGDELNIISGFPDFSFSGNGKSKSGNVKWDVTFPDIKADYKMVKIGIPSVFLTGESGFEIKGNDLVLSSQAKSSLKKVKLKAAGKDISLSEISIHCNIDKNENDPAIVKGTLNLSEAKIDDSENFSVISGINCVLPFALPYRKQVESGSCSIANIKYKNRMLGSCNGIISQKGYGVCFSGVHINEALPGLNIGFSGEVGGNDLKSYSAKISFDIPEYTTPNDIEMEKFYPGAKGVLIHGRLAAKGNFETGPAGSKGTCSAILDTCSIKIPDKKIMIKGISTSISSYDLIGLRSAPDQIISFENAEIGSITMDSGRIHFRIESPESLFIEKARFSWCGGNIDTHSLRFLSRINDYDITLFCDRLKLGAILNQLGVAASMGNGTVNGRIPLEYKNGKLRFADGFLYSTPGEGGKIQLAGTEIFTEGIPENTPQFAQLDLAREALKDYEYKWAKLGLTSEQNMLLLKLQFDGKPLKPLPFIYKKEFGGFMRVEAGSKGSFFEGISLDVNLSLPLDKILQYKNIPGMIR